MEELTGQMQALLAQGRFAPRPDRGAQGRKIPIRVNVFPVKLRSGVNISQYDVVITSTSRPPRQAAGAEPTRLPVKRSRQVMAQICSQSASIPALRTAAYDGNKNLFVVNTLPCDTGSQEFNVTVRDGGASEDFNVRVTHAQTISLDVLEQFCRRECNTEADKQSSLFAIVTLDTLYRHDPATRDNWIVSAQGRKFLDTTRGSALGEGAQVIQGFFQSVRPSSAGMVMNVDTAYSPVWNSGSLLEVAQVVAARDSSAAGGGGRGGFRGGRGGGRGGRGGAPQGGPGRFVGFQPQDVRYLDMKLRGAAVRVTHRQESKAYRIQGFGRPAGEQQITINSRAPAQGQAPTPAQRASAAASGNRLPPASRPQETLTVAQYFQRTYNRRVDPNLPCVRLGRDQFVPMDCLEMVPGNVIPPTKLSGDQAANQIRVAAKRPDERRAMVQSIRGQEAYERNPRARSWGVEISPEMLKLEGRVLNPPRVTFAQTSKMKTPRVGDGAWNLKDTKFITACKPLQRWGIINFDRRPVDGFVQALADQAAQRGMQVPNRRPVIVQGQGYSEASTLASLKEVGKGVILAPTNPKKEPPQLVIIVLTDPKKYAQIKRQAAFELPAYVPTQVVLAKNIFKDRGLDQYCGNLCMKINPKMLCDGNWELPAQDTPFLDTKAMMMGADVTHSPGGRGDDRAPSVASLVATVNSNNRICGAEVREQAGGTEIITNLKEMVKKRIGVWAQGSKTNPERIIFFRDGVSEGQLNTVLEEEITAIKAACREVHPKYNPKLTYIVCAKRHNYRFFAERDQDKDRTGNLPPGLVVDTSVTHPYLFDFYVQAQQGLQGTAKPTRYIVLLDEIGFKADQVQKLINSLCFGFARATRSVSLVPVCYYADICCEKARSLAKLDPDSDASSIASGGNQTELQPSRIQTQLERSGNLPPMWYI